MAEHMDASNNPISPDDEAEMDALDSGAEGNDDNEESGGAFIDPGVEDDVDDDDDEDLWDSDEDDEDDEDEDEDDDEDEEDLLDEDLDEDDED